MKVSYTWIKEYVSGTLPKPEKVAALLTAHAFEVDGLEKKRKDTIIDISVLPNRTHDCLSHRGIAREIAAITKTKLKKESITLRENKKIKTKDLITVTVKKPALCRRYTARVITGVRVVPSPAWLRARLEALGQRSINNIVDATNYVMLASGQPLHAFDLAKIAKKTIIVRLAQEGEIIETLDGARMTLSAHDTVIADAEGALAIAGVKGGKKAEITEATKTIVLEAATFDQSRVRKTAKRLNLRTDASIRFEAGISSSLPAVAIDEVAALIATIAGGEIAVGVVDIRTEKEIPQTVLFTADDIAKILGIRVAESDIIAPLERLGFIIQKTKKGYFATAPAQRLDIASRADIAEEVVRMKGFLDVPSVLPESTLIPGHDDNALVATDNIKDIFVSLGLSETYSRSFIGVRHLRAFSDRYRGLVPVANPLSEDQKYCRPSLLFALLDAVAENMKHQKAVRLFEVGNVFALTEKSMVNERRMIAAVCAEKAGSARDGKLFYEVKGIVDALCEKMGIDDVWYSDFAHGSAYSDGRFWHQGRTAEIKIGNKTLGAVGEIDPALLHALAIDERVAAIEIDHETLVLCAQEKKEYRPIPKFPAVERDIAVLVPRETKIDNVHYVLGAAGGELLIDSDLFDMYEGEHIDAAQKSLAFHLIFQSSARTLTDAEVDAVFAKIVSALRQEGWDVRS